MCHEQSQNDMTQLFTEIKPLNAPYHQQSLHVLTTQAQCVPRWRLPRVPLGPSTAVRPGCWVLRRVSAPLGLLASIVFLQLCQPQTALMEGAVRNA